MATDGLIEMNSKAYRDTWTLGVHSYLAYLRDRLMLCKELLADTGCIFVQIGDENLHRVRSVMDAVFGVENAIVTIVLKKKGVSTPTDPVNDFILWYAKDKPLVKVRGLYENRASAEDDAKFNTLITQNGAHIRATQLDENEWNRLISSGSEPARVNYPLVSQDFDKQRSQDLVWRDKLYKCGENRHWTFDPVIDMHRLAIAERIFDGGGKSVGGIQLWSDWPYVAMSNLWDDLHGDQEPIYVAQTNRKAILRCLLMTTDPGDLVLDPTCGSGTTAYVAEQWGRRWITIDTSRVALALARQRLLTATFPFYKVKEVEVDTQVSTETGPPHSIAFTDRSANPSQGFIYKTVSHITLKSIAQNVALDPIFAKHQPILDDKLATLNAALKTVPSDLRQRLAAKLREKERRDGKKAVTDADRRRWLLPQQGWKEWDVPFDVDEEWTPELQAALTAYRAAWRAKMDEVNACIAASTEQEELVDQPAIDKDVVRVSGPFTVEAVMPAEESLDGESPIGGTLEELETFGADDSGTEPLHGPP